MKTLLALAAAAAAFAPVPALAAPAAADWSIGPDVRGRNYSVGMPPTLAPGRDGPTFAFPAPSRDVGHVHAITVPVRSLAGARRITVRFRIDAARGVAFRGQEDGSEGWLSLYFQRAGDNWSGRGRYETYRWYSPNAGVFTLRPGTYTMSFATGDEWISVMGRNRSENPRAFDAALGDAQFVGLAFGSAAGRAHGVYATGPARFTVLDFRIE